MFKLINFFRNIIHSVEENKLLNNRIKDVKGICDIASKDGRWSKNDYTVGFANGINLAYSIMKTDGKDFKKLTRDQNKKTV